MTVPGESTGNKDRGKPVRVHDQAVKGTALVYDYAGNILRSQRQFVKEYKKSVDWGAASGVVLEDPVFESSKAFDALQRPVTETRSNGSICKYAYNRQSLLKAVRGTTEAVPNKAFIGDIQYNANNQRLAVIYSNKSVSEMTYDPTTFRMTSKKTLRNNNSIVQSLQYTRDCIENITHVEDASQQDLFFRGDIIHPTQDFIYDAIGRLRSTTGREHLGQIGDNWTAVPYSSISGTATTSSPADAKAMSNYTERYTYDSEGNILSMSHALADKTIPRWTRTFAYIEPSALEPSKQCNRLSTTVVGNTVSSYQYDGNSGINGLLSSMSGFTLIQWGPFDQLQATSTQQVTNGQTPETTWYRYDSTGKRVRKVTERFAAEGELPMRSKDHFYFDGFEVSRAFGGDGSSIASEIHTTHILAEEARVASLEVNRTPSNGRDTKTVLTRYVVEDTHSSVTLELDDTGQLLSMEEYSPYGSTTFIATSSQLKLSKQYRFSAKERDVESGLYYFEARYFVPWLGRWMSPDPIGLADSLNAFEYTRGNPIAFTDPTGTITEAEVQAAAAFINTMHRDYETPVAEMDQSSRRDVASSQHEVSSRTITLDISRTKIPDPDGNIFLAWADVVNADDASDFYTNTMGPRVEEFQTVYNNAVEVLPKELEIMRTELQNKIRAEQEMDEKGATPSTAQFQGEFDVAHGNFNRIVQDLENRKRAVLLDRLTMEANMGLLNNAVQDFDRVVTGHLIDSQEVRGNRPAGGNIFSMLQHRQDGGVSRRRK